MSPPSQFVQERCEPDLDFLGEVCVSMVRKKAPQLFGEFDLTTAPPAHAEVLLDHPALWAVHRPFDVVPQLFGGLRTTDHETTSFSMPLSLA
jgi:hypothetical protein